MNTSGHIETEGSELPTLEELLTATGNEKNCLILTPNQPLSQQLRRYRLDLAGLKNTASATKSHASVYVLRRWMTESVSKEAEKPIASELQLNWLMELALRKTLGDYPNLNPKTLSSTALSAWKRLKQYKVSYSDLKDAELGQEVYFHDVANCMDKLLRQSAVTSIETEIEHQIHHANINISKHGTVYLYAFLTTQPPLFSDWLNHCFDRIVDIPFSATALKPREIPCNKAPTLYSAEDDRSELFASANWANAVLIDDPNARIGIVHQTLQADQKRSRRIVREHLNNDFELSSALMLPASELGVIHTALALLQANKFELTTAEARRIIHATHWGVPADYAVRNDWDESLCSTQLRRLSLPDLRECIDPNLSTEHQALSNQLISFNKIRRDAPKLQTPEGWAGLFCRQLEALGWPHKNAVEFDDDQTSKTAHSVDLWFDVLTDFAACSGVSGEISLGESLSLLQQICDQKRTDPGAPHPGVRLLDTVEAAAGYTHLWITGVDQASWPSPPAPNALLPVPLQRKYGMPGADPLLEAELAKQLLDRLSEAASQVVFSYAENCDDMALSASKLLPENISPLVFPDTDICKELSENLVIEEIDTSTAPALPEDERHVRGGAYLLKQMANSPFDAFANFRLYAQPLKQPKIGLDALDRGNLVHYMMEHLWRQLCSQTQLLQLDRQQRQALCDQSADAAVRTWESRLKPSMRLSSALKQLECGRLSRLALNWLDNEAVRAPFTLEAVEQTLEAEVGKLVFQLRIDRIDKREDGSVVLLDYKTSKNLSRKAWDEFPQEPQLPLYAICLPDQPNAIGFVQLAATKTQLIGIGDIDDTGIKSTEDWGDLIANWRENLTELANDYASGDTRVYLTKAGFKQTDPFLSLHRSPEILQSFEEGQE